MENSGFRKAVKRVTVLTQSAEGGTDAQKLFKRKNKRKSSSKNMGAVEKAARRTVEAQKALLDEYLDRHESSAKKKKDGWLRDGPKNMAKAQKKAMKKLRKASPV